MANDPFIDGQATVRQILEDVHILLRRCDTAVKGLQNSNNYDSQTSVLTLQEFAEQLTASPSGLQQAALHPTSEGRLL